MDSTDYFDAFIHKAIKEGSLENLKKYIDRGGDQNGNSPLLLACGSGNLQIVNFLLSNSANIYHQNKKGDSPLSSACGNGHLEVVKLLLDKGASLEMKDKNGHSPLSLACSFGQLPVVQFLLERGAKIHHQNNNGDTCLHIACLGGHKSVILYLLERGCDYNAKNNAGETPLESLRNNPFGFGEGIKFECLTIFETFVKSHPPPPPLSKSISWQLEIAQIVQEFQRGCYQTALSIIDNTTNMYPQFYLYYKLECLYKLNNNTEALDFLDQQRALLPRQFFSYELKVGYLLRINLFDEALSCYDQMLSRIPEWRYRAHEGKARILSSLQRYEEAIIHYDYILSIKMPQSHKLHYFERKLECLENLKRHDAALSCFDQMIALDRKYLRTYEKKFEYLIKMARYEDAISSFDKIFQLKYEHDTPFCYLEARLEWLFQFGKFTNIVNSLNQFIIWFPYDLNVYELKIQYLTRMGRDEEIIACYDQMILSYPFKLYAYIRKAQLLDKLQRSKEAVVSYDQIICLDPLGSTAYEKKAEHLHNLGKTQDAISCFNLMITNCPWTLNALERKAEYLYNIKNYEAAIATYDKIILSLTSRRSLFALLYKVDCLFKLKRYDEILPCIESAIEKDSWNPFFYNEKGKTLQKLNRNEEALSCFRQAVATNDDPRTCIDFYVKGFSLFQLGNFDAALSSFNKSIELNPKHSLSYLGIAECHCSLNRIDEARVWYQKARVQDPDIWSEILESLPLNSPNKPISQPIPQIQPQAAFTTTSNPTSKPTSQSSSPSISMSLEDLVGSVVATSRNIPVYHLTSSSMVKKLESIFTSLSSCNLNSDNQSQILDNFKPVVEEMNIFLQSFRKPEPQDSLAKLVSWYHTLVAELSSHLKSFRKFNKLILELHEDLALEIDMCAADNKINECKNMNNDLDALYREVRQLRNKANLDQDLRNELKEIYESLSETIEEWRDKNVDIQDFEGHIESLRKELRELKQNQNVNVTTINTQDSNRVELELTQLRRLIEDFSQTNCSFPQLIVLLDQLNESIVSTVENSSSTLNERLAAELNKIKSLTVDFHREAVLNQENNKDPLSILLSTSSPSSYSLDQLSIRLDRLQRLLIDATKVTFDSEILGQGSFGEVRKGTYNGQTVAVKIIQTTGSSFVEKERMMIENEVLVMSLCQHPSIVQVEGVCFPDPRTAFIVMELGSLGSVHSYLSKTEHISSALAFAWLNDLFSALCHLHELKIIHRDVKPENLLLTTFLHCKLTDFGLAKQKLASSIGTCSTKGAGSFAYMAPEVRIGKKVSPRSDVYSAAITGYRMLSQLAPPSSRLREKILEYMEDYDENTRLLFANCLQDDPINRISSSEALMLVVRIQEQGPHPDPRSQPQHASPLTSPPSVRLSGHLPSPTQSVRSTSAPSPQQLPPPRPIQVPSPLAPPSPSQRFPPSQSVSIPSHSLRHSVSLSSTQNSLPSQQPVQVSTSSLRHSVSLPSPQQSTSPIRVWLQEKLSSFSGDEFENTLNRLEQIFLESNITSVEELKNHSHIYTRNHLIECKIPAGIAVRLAKIISEK